MKFLIKTFANINILIGLILIIAPVGYFIAVSYFDKQQINQISANTQRETEILSEAPFDPKNPASYPVSYTNTVAKSEIKIEKVEQPVNNTNTLEANIQRNGDRIAIDNIGLDTEIIESATSQYGLEAGVWRVPSFSTPDKKGEMTVFIAHRWGPDNISWDYRIKNLFFNIPNLNAGDIIRINWKGVEYRYRVTYKEDSTYATRTADLLLVTCRYLSSDVRVLVYAERI